MALSTIKYHLRQLFTRDSVFSKYLSDPFSEDKPLTPEKEIEKQLDSIELPAIQLFNKTYDRALNNAVNQLSDAIAKKDEKKIKNYKWSLGIGLSNNLWAEWQLGWQNGANIANKELGGKSIAEFSQPEAESAIIRNRPAEEAIRSRINTLASDVSNSEWEDIRGAILDSIQPQSATQSPISRRELIGRINEVLGDKKDRFKNRAENIARTELTFAYNAGRLDSYVRSGLVAGVKFLSIFDDRRCEICKSRHGIVVALDDYETLARLVIPVHPRCRCVWSPILKEKFDKVSVQPGRKIKDRRLLKGRPWLSAAILAALIIPEELFFVGLLSTGIKILVGRLGGTQAARAFIANKIAQITGQKAKKPKQTEAKEREGLSLNKVLSRVKNKPVFMASPGVNLNVATDIELKNILLVPKLNDSQIRQIKKIRRINPLTFEGLKEVLNPYQVRQLRTIARKNYIFDLLHPNNNLTPSALWVNSGGIISKKQAEVVYRMINKEQFANKNDLLKALRKFGVDAEKLDKYSDMLASKKYV